MDLTKILAGLTGAVVETAKAAADKKITVDEALDIVKKGVDGAGLGDKAIVDFENENTPNSAPVKQ